MRPAVYTHQSLCIHISSWYTRCLSVGMHTRVAPDTHLAFVLKCAAARATGDHGALDLVVKVFQLIGFVLPALLPGICKILRGVPCPRLGWMAAGGGRGGAGGELGVSWGDGGAGGELCP